MNAHTPGPWILATSNSWRRFVSQRGGCVCEPITQNDGHPDLHFANGGQDGPDARLIAAAPTLLAALMELESHCYAGALDIPESHPAIAQARAAIANVERSAK